MFLMVETGVKGGMRLFINMQKLIANIKDYGKNKKLTYLKYWDGQCHKRCL